jgi:hypothetical protein
MRHARAALMIAATAAADGATLRESNPSRYRMALAAASFSSWWAGVSGFIADGLSAGGTWISSPYILCRKFAKPLPAGLSATRSISRENSLAASGDLQWCQIAE